MMVSQNNFFPTVKRELLNYIALQWDRLLSTVLFHS